MHDPSSAKAGVHDAYEVLPGDEAGGLILLCDHATNRLPAAYGSLGLPPDELERHIAYDIGAAALTRGLAERFGVPAVLSRFSRLLIDPNRGQDDPTLVMRLSDGAVIPGNARINAAERRRRIEEFYQPYDEAIGHLVDRSLASGHVPAILSIHSFTPIWRGTPRPWHAGILWDQDPRLARALIEGLASQGDLVVGDNEPYHGALKGDTLYRHATERGLSHALLEVRQDLIADLAGVREWVDRIAAVLAPLDLGSSPHGIDFFGSSTGPVARRG
ncbi:N-formylglutamate amidohydrolase [Kaistia algarum]|uniref:N-formylglutamate amidohydrolase n=1 Tax=Kaistia algarum TaxID=2083279 RepID=UPI000CE91FDC|nr:N-formylglutamate amidohydrolase [Kaistia algarum]MCX5516397.1 N-formylglutamate amidohydrolase [Kaistia algarum]PPE78690.1 N-formylglutamate amidohydrolase [Kaistia algarum]